MARKDLGGKREQDEFSLLLSPSRGIQDDDPTSLKNPLVQERFRDYIRDKLNAWSAAYPLGTRPRDLQRRNEELGIILLDLRKLREGIHSIQRVDAFASEVYEASVLLSLVASNHAQLSASLSHLVTVIHPTLASSDLATSLSSLSVSTRPARPRPCPATRSFYIALHLLHSHLLPACTSLTPTVSSASVTSTHAPLASFLPALLALLDLSSLPHPPTIRPSSLHHHPDDGPPPDPSITFLLALHLAFIRSSVSTISTICSSLPLPPRTIIQHAQDLFPSRLGTVPPNPLALILKDALPGFRESVWNNLVKRSFRFPPDRTTWLSKWFLFEFEIEIEQQLYGVVGKVLVEEEDWELRDQSRQDEVQREAEQRVVAFVNERKT
ncbi:uncharacterized protein JCM15063_003037 [Sporobolomyces koalae]|uniref:uncharacterized protein n=1 Tax=Sporobolomyces koalae TaxID=500713 RepID=UPI003176C64F